MPPTTVLRNPRPASLVWVWALKFAGAYSHRTFEGGIGHDLPREATEASAEAALRGRGGGR